MTKLIYVKNNDFLSPVVIKLLAVESIHNSNIPAAYHSFFLALPIGKYLTQNFDNQTIIWIKVDDAFDASTFGQYIAHIIIELKCEKVALHFEYNDECISQIAFSILQRVWVFNKFKTSREFKLQELEIDLKNYQVFKKYDALLMGINISKELSESPPNIIYPQTFIEHCNMLKQYNVELEILGLPELKALGLNALLAVAQGSAKEPKVLIMKYLGNKSSHETIGLIGKGVCFDSGGLFIKTQDMMPKMKYDKSAAASIVGGILAIAKQELELNVIGVVGLVENMPDGEAARPSDVIVSMSGQTIEIADPDAEGRLVLADCLYYAYKTFNPSILITFGTLTGETVACLSNQYAGLFCKDSNLTNQIIDAGKSSSDLVWHLPCGKSYAKQIESSIADLKNVGIAGAGENAAAAEFLMRFCGESKFAHLDIAGMAWNDEDALEHRKGATGYGVKLIEQLCRDILLA